MMQKPVPAEAARVVARIGATEDFHDESAAIRRWESLLGAYLRTAARVIAGDQPGLADDLYQEALIHLWELDPARFDERDAGYVRNALHNRMMNAARDEGRRRFWDRPAAEVREKTRKAAPRRGNAPRRGKRSAA